MQLPYKARFGGAKFRRGWNQLMYGSSTLLRGAHKLLVVHTFSFFSTRFSAIMLHALTAEVYAVTYPHCVPTTQLQSHTTAPQVQRYNLLLGVASSSCDLYLWKKNYCEFLKPSMVDTTGSNILPFIVRYLELRGFQYISSRCGTA